MEPDYLDVVRRFYPNALTTGDSVDRLLDLLHQRLGLQPAQIMSADSICSDDLSIIEYPERAYEMLGPFKIGGLNGFPFTGLTGMGAFAHHVPANGAVFVFHAPHIGIGRDGSTAQILRPGQSTRSACCGAAKAAVGKLERGEIVPGEITGLDYQQNTIEQILLAARERILGAGDRLLEVTEVMYEAIERRIDTLVGRTRYPCHHLILMGAVMINADHEAGSFASLRRLHYVDARTGERQDWAGGF
jgi:hypothetical protein